MSSQDIILSLLQKKLHHDLSNISVEEVLLAMHELSMQVGFLEAKTDRIREGQVFLQKLLMDKIKNGIVDNEAIS